MGLEPLDGEKDRTVARVLQGSEHAAPPAGTKQEGIPKFCHSSGRQQMGTDLI